MPERCHQESGSNETSCFSSSAVISARRTHGFIHVHGQEILTVLLVRPVRRRLCDGCYLPSSCRRRMLSIFEHETREFEYRIENRTRELRTGFVKASVRADSPAPASKGPAVAAVPPSSGELSVVFPRQTDGWR